MVVHDDCSSPPIDFPVYGLDATWLGRRWFDYYQAGNGRRVWAVGLGHRSADDTGGGIIVSTLRRAPYGATLTHGHADPLVEIAFDSAVRLGNATLPEVDVPRPHGLLKALVTHMQYESEHYQDWPVASWKVEGNPIIAPVLSFADGWVTFTDAVSDVYVSVLALDIPLTSSSLNATKVADLREYGLNPGADLGQVLDARNQRPNAMLPARRSLHPDLLALIT